MKNLQSILPACAFVVGAVLVALTSAFTVAPKADSDPFWTLRDGITQVSTNPADYMQSPNECQGDALFCGFTAPETSAQQPDISANPNLLNDLTDLQSNPTGQSNASGVISFKD